MRLIKFILTVTGIFGFCLIFIGSDMAVMSENWITFALGMSMSVIGALTSWVCAYSVTYL